MTVASLTAAASTPATASDPLKSLTQNFGGFLQLLTTQLRNQDPTSPLDANQFTTELVQFTSVEQQISTNTNLKQLIQITQGSQIAQAAGMLGRQVAVASDHLSLQDGRATVRFTAPLAGPVGIVVTTDAGRQVFAGSIAAASGANSWNWDGHDADGRVVADGAYRVTVASAGADGASTALDTTIVGRATGVRQTASGVQLELGALPVDFADLRGLLD